jgi:DNA-binding transcriptional ArsR family regulator
MGGAQSAEDVGVVRSAQAAAVLLHPTRLSLLEALARPDSAAGLARRLGLPRQQLNYHLHELEREGLVELVEERRKGNCLERIVRATAHSYLISPEALGRLGADPAAVQDRFSSAYQVAVAARAIRDLAVLRERASRAGRPLATLTLEAAVRFASAAARHAFAEELARAVATLVTKYHDEAAKAGRLYRFFLGAYPAITKNDEDAPPPAPKEQGA